MPSLGDWRYQLLLARARKKIKSAKRRARPELTTRAMWQNNDYANTFSLSTDKVEDGLERISVHEVSTQQFIDRFEAPGLPVVVEGAQEGWRAGARWTLQRLGKKYRHQPFKVGTDAEGQSVRVKLKYYLEYLATNRDDSPLYIFDHDYGEDPRRGRLLEDYSLPEYCREDLMQYMGEERRPPYRWVVLGPARSGTGIHIDPLATSAWNALVRGTKRWCFFPPCTPGSVVGAGLGLEAAEWWAQVYPATRAGSWPQEFRPIECIQRAGETVFVPGGWWHVVVNLEPAVAVTQNYCSSTNFPQVWAKVVRGRPGLASVWRTNLASCRPDLAALADKDLPCSGEESILVWSSTDGGTGGWVPSPGPEQGDSAYHVFTITTTAAATFTFTLEGRAAVEGRVVVMEEGGGVRVTEVQMEACSSSSVRGEARVEVARGDLSAMLVVVSLAEVHGGVQDTSYRVRVDRQEGEGQVVRGQEEQVRENGREEKCRSSSEL